MTPAAFLSLQKAPMQNPFSEDWNDILRPMLMYILILDFPICYCHVSQKPPLAARVIVLHRKCQAHLTRTCLDGLKEDANNLVKVDIFVWRWLKYGLLRWDLGSERTYCRACMISVLELLWLEAVCIPIRTRNLCNLCHDVSLSQKRGQRLVILLIIAQSW